MAKPFKRYYTGQSGPKRGSGKGSERRDMQVSQEVFAENWDRIFGTKDKPSDPQEDTST